MSKLLAADGRGQHHDLDAKIDRRGKARPCHEERSGDLSVASVETDREDAPGLLWPIELRLDAEVAGLDREEVRLHPPSRGIEARSVWKPMRLQPAHAADWARDGEIAVGLFADGFWLPSESSSRVGDEHENCDAARSVLTS